MIGPDYENITVTKDKAELVCYVRANPAPSPDAVRWRQLSSSLNDVAPREQNKLWSSQLTKQRQRPQAGQKNAMNQKLALADIRCNKVTRL
ncbi:unnamed protein product [Protopolystoma xenopodis]|uniref:Uncharacterized protein n=1 Tax=Protopolystoma xenopodis TaxID=117903 RepID=A0A3S5CKX6_9PLAT|nr:unnamed protein product [Protopolystoma xenopodis]